MNVKTVVAGPEHIPSLVEGMSPFVKSELNRRHPHLSVEDVLSIAFQRADEAHVVYFGDDMICVMGVNGSVLSTVGYPWIIPHVNVNKHKWMFLKGCRPWLKYLLSKYETLENSVDARNKKAVRWLKWLGFTVDPTVDLNGVEVHPYRIKRA